MAISDQDTRSPIETHRQEILSALDAHDVVIVVAATGSGKSTLVPRILLGTAERVIVTQPRRIAAESLARHVAREMNTDIAGLVGFCTAHQKMYSEDTRIIYCTDGIEVLRQLHRQTNPSETVYVLDEVHEWNLNLELLLAWFKKELLEEKNIKLVILSATIDEESLAEFFGSTKIIHCEGRAFPIQEIAHAGSVDQAAVEALAMGQNVLIFVPGKQEIQDTIQAITKTGVRARCLPFHADLNALDIAWVFEPSEEPKCVVATTIAQTSLTLPDIDVVIDSGLERGNDYRHGINGLYTRPTSLAERVQRRGRAGRVKPGIYIDCSHISHEKRSPFSAPAIERQELTDMVLQIMSAGYDPHTLPFFHQPRTESVLDALRVLSELDFLDDKGIITDLGRKAARLPLGARAARMLLAGVHDGVVDYNAITLATVFSNKTLDFKTNRRQPLTYDTYDEVGASDAFENIKVYDAACQVPPHTLSSYGIDQYSFERLQDHRAEIVDRISRLGYTQGRPHLRLDARYVTIGLKDQVFVRSKVSRTYTKEHGVSTPRKLPSKSTMEAEKVVGMPWNFETYTPMGPVVRRFLLWATALPN